MANLSDREREAVAIGAAIGAGCRPCTRYHVKAAQDVGLSENEVKLAVKDAELLRIESATSIADYAQQLLGREKRRESRLCNPTESLQALTLVGAATGGNAGYVLDGLLPQARGLGLSNDALKDAIQLAETVREAAANFFRKDMERALAREGEVAEPEGGDGCIETHIARGEAVEASPRGCC